MNVTIISVARRSFGCGDETCSHSRPAKLMSLRGEVDDIDTVRNAAYLTIGKMPTELNRLRLRASSIVFHRDGSKRSEYVNTRNAFTIYILRSSECLTETEQKGAATTTTRERKKIAIYMHAKN